ncbi:MAG: RagB/SusD family nutrient uptake outer membrane protein [Mangrovibacterium sp.]
MKQINHICYVALVALSASCTNGFLEEDPDNRLEINTLKKANELLVYASNEGSYAFLEQMTDNVSYIADNMHLSGLDDEIFNWKESLNEDQDGPIYFWNNGYYAIAQANAVLSRIDELEGDEAYKKHIKGEALLFRAYNHFMLVNIFAMPYSSATLTSQGIPYVEELETNLNTKYTNNTIGEVYEKIERDMLDGLSLIDDSYIREAPKYHFNKKAALAFASRFYLWTGNNEKCIDYSTQMLGSAPSQYIRNYSLLFNAGGSAAAGVAFINTAEKSNLLVARRETLYSLRYDAKDRLSTSQFQSIFLLNILGSSGNARALIAYYGNSSYTCVRLAKNYEYFRRTSLSSNIGYPYRIDVLFRGEEVLLNRAEAYSNLGKTDEGIADLEILLKARYLDDLSFLGDFAIWVNYYDIIEEVAGLDEAGVLADLIERERRREFMEEGIRWFDIRRLGLTVSRANGNVLTANDSRKAVAIPELARESLGIGIGENSETASERLNPQSPTPGLLELINNN